MTISGSPFKEDLVRLWRSFQKRLYNSAFLQHHTPETIFDEDDVSMKTNFCVGAVFFLILLMFIVGTPAISQNGKLAQSKTNGATPTIAIGGLFAGYNELRCPINLSGTGATWRGIVIGQSNLEDVKRLYTPYIRYSTITTPLPPLFPTYDLKENLASLYVIRVDTDDFNPQLGLPRDLKVCTVDNKVAALVAYTWDDPTVPHTIEQWVSLLGRPNLVSWSETDTTCRMLHWPQDGISVELCDQSNIYYSYYYPFLDSNIETQWPLNALLRTPPFPDLKSSELEPAWIDYGSIEATQTVKPAWPTRTPLAVTQTSTPKLP